MLLNKWYSNREGHISKESEPCDQIGTATMLVRLNLMVCNFGNHYVQIYCSKHVHEHTICAVQLTFELQRASDTKDGPCVEGLWDCNNLR